MLSKIGDSTKKTGSSSTKSWILTDEVLFKVENDIYGTGAPKEEEEQKWENPGVFATF